MSPLPQVHGDTIFKPLIKGDVGDEGLHAAQVLQVGCSESRRARPGDWIALLPG